MNCLLLGNNGREAIIADEVSKGMKLFSILPYKNETIVNAVEKSGGKYQIGAPSDKELVRKFIKENEIELLIVNSDSLLEEGLIDIGKELGIDVFGPTKKGAKIEWSKSYALDIIEELAPEIVVRNYNITEENMLNEVYEKYKETEFVVKPEGLTAGKGVKVGGVHFTTKDEGFDYARKCFKESGSVIIQDKVEGHEFTIMGFTDGKTIITSPVTYDYPYRFDGDLGPGTGGMGCISAANGLLSFLTNEDLEKCKKVMNKVLQYINKDTLEFNGVLYGAFFKTNGEIKFLEFNSRLGDPECLNVLTAMKTPFHEVVKSIAIDKEIKCEFKKEDTCVVYAVSKEYAIKSNDNPEIFTIDKNAIESNGVKVYFSAVDSLGNNKYKPTGTSRLFAIVGNSRDKVYEVVKNNVPKELDYRMDIGKGLI